MSLTETTTMRKSVSIIYMQTTNIETYGKLDYNELLNTVNGALLILVIFLSKKS